MGTYDEKIWKRERGRRQEEREEGREKKGMGKCKVCVKPAMVKIINVITIDGIVVSIIYRIWENKGVCDTEEANTVVSESGEILSPK